MAGGGEPVVRGNSNEQPLAPGGAAQLADTGAKMAKMGGASQIVSSSAQRAQESAAQLQGADPNQPPVSVTTGLESHALGNLEGEPETPQVRKLLADLIRKNPDQRIPGQGALSNRPGESFNEFRVRALTAIRGLMQALASAPQQRIVAVVHSQIIKLLKAWLATGLPDDLKVNSDAMLKTESERPGEVDKFAPGPKGDWTLTPFDLKGKDFPMGAIYFVRHGQTDSNTVKNAGQGQVARAQIIKNVRSQDWGRARATAQRAVAARHLSDQDVGEAVDEALPSAQDAAQLSPHHLLAAYSAASPNKRQELAPVMQQVFSPQALAQTSPEAQRALSAHLARLG
jgi:broad specificity phosphatase PhoE